MILISWRRRRRPPRSAAADPRRAGADRRRAPGFHRQACQDNGRGHRQGDAARPAGTKALAAGQQTTSTIVLPDVVVQGRPGCVDPRRVADGWCRRQYSFLQQSVRTLNAAPVAAGGTKPTSVVSVVAIENRLRVVAHISEQIDHYLLSDAVNLERFVEDELVCGAPGP